MDWLRTTRSRSAGWSRDFLHGKAFLVHSAVLAGSSNFTYAGLIRNRELNLGVYSPHTVRQVAEWFDEQWDDAAPYDLAGLTSPAGYPIDRAPFLRMLYELYGLEPPEPPGRMSSTSRSNGTAYGEPGGSWPVAGCYRR